MMLPFLQQILSKFDFFFNILMRFRTNTVCAFSENLPVLYQNMRNPSDFIRKRRMNAQEQIPIFIPATLLVPSADNFDNLAAMHHTIRVGAFHRLNFSKA